MPTHPAHPKPVVGLASRLPEPLVELIACRFALLSDPARIHLLEVLERGDASAQELSEQLQSTQETVSGHLMMLHQAGMVSCRQAGGATRYSLVDWMGWWLVEQVARSVHPRALGSSSCDAGAEIGHEGTATHRSAVHQSTLARRLGRAVLATRRASWFLALTAVIAVGLALAPDVLAAAGNDVGRNLGSLLRQYAGQVYGGVVAIVSVIFLINRRYVELGLFLLAAVVVGWMVFSPDQVARAARGIGERILR